ncbi:MerR family transcriptional regulator [Microbulbifer sp. OS29]|uniref:MerR family transcriptional regulator n=1 Tax=Microbulbifer okhotskensis TaxID=2926617 RepID=A0A9X2ETJ8_9GAMM|nr:MerR family transcriptional regulator [Microbulbifer okhotskensis]MCO1335526.1 MerR family transcriptional regulator [Microbulbifer okhotskensis]
MFIGEVSKKTGLSVRAIRLYEEKGLIKPPKRQGRYRVYTQVDIEVLNLISEAKDLGVTLATLKNVIIYESGEVDWERIRRFLFEVRDQLKRDMQTIQIRIRRVERCIGAIDDCQVGLDSPPKGRD